MCGGQLGSYLFLFKDGSSVCCDGIVRASVGVTPRKRGATARQESVLPAKETLHLNHSIHCTDANDVKELFGISLLISKCDLTSPIQRIQHPHVTDRLTDGDREVNRLLGLATNLKK